MIKKVLIANRGEIAVRIIRACREMGIETVAVYSEADREALHTKLADEAVCIGPAPSSESYLSMDRIISATIITGADAIHPGFGFLSENSRFAELCEQCNITFIGPASQVIAKLGNKQEARNTMAAAGVPVIPGSKEPIYDAETGAIIAKEIGYPVIVKAALGGGGKGMRIANTPEEFEQSFQTAQKETQMAFGDNTMYIEHFVQHPRHIEFQILADIYGNVVHLGERDCSIQRNHQKMIEESPSVALSPRMRKQMGEAAVRAAKASGYQNAGTIEFLLEKNGNFYFMEMNTRIQVEHPVTEWVTGIDLIKEQIRIASGKKLSFSQSDIHLNGHAIECRINAENPAKGFRPSPGTITDMYLPGGKGIRIDSAIYSGYTIPPYYDSMVAKLIVWAKNRAEAVRKMQSALGEVIIEGIDTNVDYQYEILSRPDYLSGNIDIEFIAENEKALAQAVSKEF
ncbi:MAG: acetyl-CoA carboxylase biotin carboxylase subunit [Dorea sp.]|jgi:acetyl-CoA carboxylase biotin carboxylase subunit|nr:acetyl-CoA carboxylase biotin carboxylase subunit [Dorea sp.]